MRPASVLVFDIETVPDVEAGRVLNNLDGLSDDDVAKAMRTLRLQKTGTTDFLSHPQHRIVAISAVLQTNETLKVWSLGDENSSEADLLTRFFDGIERFRPTLVSWNGSGFDLPVIHYRALKHGIVSRTYWDTGETDRDFKFNNYLNRFHPRHIDLMDVLAGYQNRAFAPLDDISVILGFPGKMGVSGSQVWSLFQEGKIKEIRDYCETDVLNTFLVYLRFEHIRDGISADQLRQEEDRLAAVLESSDANHLTDYLEAWRLIQHEGCPDGLGRNPDRGSKSRWAGCGPDRRQGLVC